MTKTQHQAWSSVVQSHSGKCRQSRTEVKVQSMYGINFLDQLDRNWVLLVPSDDDNHFLCSTKNCHVKQKDSMNPCWLHRVCMIFLIPFPLFWDQKPKRPCSIGNKAEIQFWFLSMMVYVSFILHPCNFTRNDLKTIILWCFTKKKCILKTASVSSDFYQNQWGSKEKNQLRQALFCTF